MWFYLNINVMIRIFHSVTRGCSSVCTSCLKRHFTCVSFSQLRHFNAVCSHKHQLESNHVCRKMCSTSEAKADENRLLKKNYIYVKTCNNFWADVPHGIVIDVEYYDSQRGEPHDPKMPVVLALHNSPGSHDDLLPILRLLAELGYRVVAPNFPGDGKTKPIKWKDQYVFTGGLEERGHFIVDFISQLDIKRVDVLLAHGTGCTYAVMLTSFDKKMFRSTTLICPSEHKHTNFFNGLVPLEKAQLFSKLCDSMKLRPFLFLFIFLTKWRLGLSEYSVKQIISAIRAHAGFQFNRISGYMVANHHNDVPRCMVYDAGKRARVSPETSEDYAKLLGINSEDFSVYGEDKTVIRNGKADFPKGIRIEEETTDIIETYSKQIVRLIRDLIKTMKT